MIEKFVTVGKLGRTRGLDGELYVILMTDFPNRFLHLSDIYLKIKNRWEKKQIVSTRFVSERLVIKFENINTLEDATRFINCELGVPLEQVVKLPEGSYYVFDLIGCEVFDNDKKDYLGRIVDVMILPANDVYVIKSKDNKELLIAAVKKFVKKVDIENKQIFIDKAGMLEQ